MKEIELYYPKKSWHRKENPEPVDTKLMNQLEALSADDIVYHKKFGGGNVIKINKNEKYIYVRFALGDKKFLFPDAFLMGFLEVE